MLLAASLLLTVAAAPPPSTDDVWSRGQWTIADGGKNKSCSRVDPTLRAAFKHWVVDPGVSIAEEGIYALTNPKDRKQLILLFASQAACASVTAGGAMGKAGAVLPPGAVGVVYLLRKTGGALFLRLVFPEAAVKDRERIAKAGGGVRVRIDGALHLFDADGTLGELPEGLAATTTMWCHNDGGEQYRPELELPAPAWLSRRKPHGVEALQKIAAFVMVGDKKLATVTPRRGQDIRLRGDRDGDGFPDAIVHVIPDDAGNCDGLPRNDLETLLETAAGTAPLRCCGP